jgi:hypothetical protein
MFAIVSKYLKGFARLRSGFPERDSIHPPQSSGEDRPFRHHPLPIVDTGKPYAIGVGRQEEMGLAVPFHRVRVDEIMMDHRAPRCTGYFFDARTAGTFFGWHGVMSEHANGANGALVHQIAHCRANGVTTVLIHDETTTRLRFFSDFAELFDDSDTR